MLPALVSAEVRETLLDYLRTTWSLADHVLERALFELLEGDRSAGGAGIFRGPYLRIRLPFEPAPPDARHPLDLRVRYTPHRHQLIAWQRLSSKDGREPQPTLVVTGTGSGKTEAFLMPILDHALRARQRGEKGIKAIVLYPMNALAADQARRVGELVWGTDEGAPMRGRLRVGMYVGGDGEHRVMGRDHVIDDRDQLRAEPPDILLTNYKMLDLLLLRGADRRLWEDNRPETLRYLVLDELHTYDGAQGTDVACLIRRLGARLGGSRFCPVGTSATVTGEGGAGHQKLVDFASKIFGREIATDGVVGEARRTPATFFALFGPGTDSDLPADVGALSPSPEDGIETLIARLARAFFPKDPLFASPGQVDRSHLGDRIARHTVARELIALASERIREMDELDAALCARLAAWRARSPADRTVLLDALLALVSWAEREGPGGEPVPLVSLQVQIWVREVRRLLRALDRQPRFAWHDEDPPTVGMWLPMVYCHTCGHSGWITVYDELSHRLETELARINQASLARSAEILYLHHDDSAAGDDALPGLGDHVCVQCRTLTSGPTCSRCSRPTLPMRVHRALSQATPPRDLQRCPACGTDGALVQLASRAASLASVAIGHLYTTPFNTDRKLLAFSDSVQDASHRAGFFSGRTYRFSLRTAMLATVPRDGAIRLTDIAPAMVTHWGEQVGTDVMVATFMPRDLDYLEAYGNYLDKIRLWREQGSSGREPAPSTKLRAQLGQRLQWEVTRELGLAARIGRTLERVGSAGVRVDGERFEKALARIEHVAPNRLGTVQGVDRERWRRFLAGLCVRLRLRGGVFDPLLQAYFQHEGGGRWLSKQTQPLLSPFARFTSRPIFLTDAADPARFDTIQPSRVANWYTDWAGRALQVSMSVRDATELYATVLPLLVEAGLVVAHAERRKTTWALAPDALWVEREPSDVACDVCGASHAVLPGVGSIEGAPCLRFRCAGTLSPTAPEVSRVRSYYRRFYDRAELGRVWAEEHTGLLEPDHRKLLERDFKERLRPDAPNLLSCTPTLEMGIDIGDLSATMLVSVPPSASSYLQRIGRAGRQTGNALVLTFTTVRPHDLHFFDEPGAMMSGVIETPGCYLDAPEILKRQALAFCFDAWAREASDADTLPRQVREIFFGAEDRRFPAPFFRFLEQHRDRLREGFLRLFGTSESTRSALFTYLAGVGSASSPMEQQLALVLDGVRSDREDLRRHHRRVVDRLKALDEAGIKIENADEERTELEREKRYLERELAAMQDQSFLSLLSVRSVLPNYAFPEAGVQLRAYVAKDGATPGSGSAERYEWVRASSTAIRELAPFNTFYGMARKVRVDNVDVGSGRGGRPAEHIERWQLCSACGHMEPEALLTSRAECPRCSAPDFKEKGRRRDLVRMARVSAFTHQRDAAFSDESEDRDRERYVTQTFFDADSGTARNAWLDAQTPFGFELLTELTLRELNFGLVRRVAGTQRVGGRDVPDVAFLVCEECGQVHDDSITVAQQRHRRWCASRTKPEDKQPWKAIHLYREVRTEALRIFVPVSMLDPHVRLPNARAALELGMRRFFGGDPDHLRVEAYDEPSLKDPTSRRRFLVVHDTVPGGTGVLPELTEHRGAKLRRVLEEAKEALSTCACRERGAAACYRCLYAYRHQADLAVLDRKVALEIVQQLLSAFERLAPVPTIGVLDTATVVESELEQRFLDELTRWAGETSDATLSRVEVARWSLEIGGRQWTLEAQVTLDPGHDVAIETRPDFVLWPASGTDALAVAIYCDGAAYHVQPHEPRARLSDDARKREAVRRSGRFRVVSLSWDDLESFAGRKPDIGPWIEREPTRALIEQVAGRVGGDALRRKVRAAVLGSPMEALLEYARDPDPIAWKRVSALIAVGCLQADRRLASDAAALALADRLRRSEEVPRLMLEAGTGDELWAPLFVGGHSSVLLLFHGASGALGRALEDPALVHGVLRLDDTLVRRQDQAFPPAWRAWLRAHAALQALPGLEVATSEQLLAPLDLVSVPRIERHMKVAEPTSGGALTREAETELAGLDERARPIVVQVVLGGVGLPDIPYEHMNADGELVGQLHAGWPDRKLGLALEEEGKDADMLRAEGWAVLDVEGLTEAQLRAALGAKH